MSQTASESLEDVQGWSHLRQHWLVIGPSGQLVPGRPLAITLMNLPLVLYRPTQDTQQVIALVDRCPHRGAPLSAGQVLGDRLQCPYHGWQFDRSGECVYRPGLSDQATCQGKSSTVSTAPAIPTIEVCQQHGLLLARLQPPANREAEPPAFRPWFADPTLDHFLWQETVHGKLVDVMENLLDATHTPFVHGGLIRSVGREQTFQATVTVDTTRAEAHYTGEQQQSGWVSRLLEGERACSYGRYLPPATAELEYRSHKGTEFVLNAFFAPISPTEHRMTLVFFIRRNWIPRWLKRWTVTPLFRRVLKQDRTILEKQQANRERFAKFPQLANDHSWDGDLLRGWIDYWMQHGHLPQQPHKANIELHL